MALFNRRRLNCKRATDAIPYQYFYYDGMIEDNDGYFSTQYNLGDVNFLTASNDEQERIFYGYRDLLAGIEDGVNMQVLIHNIRENDRLSVLQKVSYGMQRDGLNRYRNLMNELLSQRLLRGKNGLRQQKYIILSTKSDNPKKAQQRLENMGKNVMNAVKRIAPSMESDQLTAEQRLRSFFEIYNPDEKALFENATRKDGTPYFSFRFMEKQGRTTKDEIQPSGMRFESKYFEIGEAFGKALYVDKIPPKLSAEFLQEIANTNCTSLISIHYEPFPTHKAMKLVKNRITALDTEEASYKGTPPKSLELAKAGAEDLLEDFVDRKERAYYMSMTVVVFADTREELEDYADQIILLGGNRRVSIRALYGRQMEGLNSCLPLGRVFIKEQKLLTTVSAAVFLPFTSLELEQPEGINYGMNQVSKNQIFYNRLTNKNYNGLIFGKPGGGKSALVKMEIFQLMLRSRNNHIHVIDPHGEYVEFARRMGGEVISFSPTSTKYLNPFDMEIDFSSDEDSLQVKSDYILGMIEMMRHGSLLSSSECSIVDRCVRNIYRGYIDHMEARHELDGGSGKSLDKEASPTLKDLYYELRRQEDAEAAKIAKDIEMYAVGSMQLVSNRTNIDTDNRLLVYDIRKLGSGTRNLALYVCINAMRNAAIDNCRNGIMTYLYIDEMQSIMSSDTSIRPIANIWQTIRKFGGVPTGILQNTANILASNEGRNIMNNSNTVIILDVGADDRVNLGKFLHLSDKESDYINNVRTGSGLFCAGALRVPFDNYIDKEQFPEIYELIDTTVSQVSTTAAS